MGKHLIILGLFFVPLTGFSPPQPKPKPLTVTGEIPDWNNVIFVIDQSNAPHLSVVAAKDFLLKQLTDSTKQKK